MTTVEELRKQAEELQVQAAQIERDDRRKKLEEQYAAKAAVEIKIHQEVAEALVMRLKTVGIPAEIKIKPENDYRKGFPYVALPGENWSHMIGIDVSWPNEHITITVGAYGERPQSWRVDKPENYVGIVKSVQRRLQQKKLAAEKQTRERAAYETKCTTEKASTVLADRLRAEFKNRPQEINIRMSDEADKVVVSFNAKLNEAQARSIISQLSSLASLL